MRPYLWKPILISFVAFLSLVVVSYFAVTSFASQWTYGALIGTLLFALFFWFFAIAMYLALAGMASSWLWGSLSRAVEEITGATVEEQNTPFFLDALPRVLFAFFIILACALSGWCGGFPAVLLAGWLSLYDYTSCYYLRRGVAFPDQFTQAPKLRGAISFGLACGILSLIPLLNVVLMPGMVAGATLMCLSAEADASIRRPKRRIGE